MNPEIKAKWVAALRSGQYKQTTGGMHKMVDGDCYFCAVGVLEDLCAEAHEAGWRPNKWTEWMRPSYVNDQENSCWSGISELCQEWSGATREDVDWVMGCNDHDGRTFEEIADRIEESDL